MKKLIFKIIGLIVLLTIQLGYAQNNEDYDYYKAVGVSLFNEHVAFPFNARSDSPTHLGFTISYELSRKRKGIYQFTHIFQGGYYYHKGFNQALFLSWKPKFELRFAKTFDIHAILGVGYAHSFPTEATFIRDNGKYKHTTNWGKPHFMPSIGLGTGLHLQKWLNIPVNAFVRYEAFSLAPYAIKTSVPLTINSMMSFGITYTFSKNK